MSREIKFRAYHTDEKIFWYFNLVTVRTSQAIDRDWFRLEPAQQYTGLKDKNGKEIYESDHLKDSGGYIWIVFWYNDHACFGVKSVDNSVVSEIIDNGNMEVIGNVYETLLKP